MTRPCTLAVVAAALLHALPVGADEPTTAPGPRAPTASPVPPPPPPPPGPVRDDGAPKDGPHTMFQAGVSLLALPAAEVCPVSPDVCEPGETSLAFSLFSLGRWDDVALGAGIVWGFGLGTDAAAGDPDGSLGRERSRSYFMYQGEFRYYPPRLPNWEWYVGGTAGGVVINDSWTVLADREPYADTAFVGPRALTLSTEGGGIGAVIGGHWRFADKWLLGTHFRYANWFLPTERAATPIGDLASLAGRIDVLDVGLALSFRLPI